MSYKESVMKTVRQEKCVREKNIKEIQNEISRMNDRLNWHDSQSRDIKLHYDAYVKVLKELE